MNPNLEVKIGRLKFKNPVTVASGTFGYAEEFKDFINLKKLGAIFTKTITLKPRLGNPPPRTCETPAGMLNSIGLENPGIEGFIKEKLPFLKKIGVPIIVSIASEAGADEFMVLARRLDKIKEVAAIELNISCPNIKEKKTKRLISQDADATYDLVKSVRKVTKKMLITKLSPHVPDITEIACAAEKAGSDAVSLINTFPALSIDIETHRPQLATVTGGLSGPAIRPIAVRMVWEVYQKVKIPIIGIGGIIDASSALEFFLAGATAISIGMANFINPAASTEILEGVKKYLIKNKIKDIRMLTGALKT
ncbi:MAG: dihydroorotate dehydrogenase [Candidatus Omnitrophica bacterium]|nr:dihydroorotate dehydrogenase [Candidatus Omnitrophota bacterium]